MAAYGVFQAVCGFNCHGPRGHIEFAPRLGRDDFRAAFTSAEGWGTITQARDENTQTNAVQVRHGRLRLKTLAVDVAGRSPSSVKATQGGTDVAATLKTTDGLTQIELAREITLDAGQSLTVKLS